MEIQKLHAGSLYKNYLVLYGNSKDRVIIRVDDRDVQWDIYCNDVEFESKSLEKCEIIFNDVKYEFDYFLAENPMKYLGFS